MIGKLMGKVVDTGADIIRRHQEGKITITEAEAELRKLGLELEGKALDSQRDLNVRDAESDDPVRTRWRPLGAIGILILFVAQVAAYGIDGTVWVEVLEPEKREGALDMIRYLGWIVCGLFGIREGGKAFGNR